MTGFFRDGAAFEACASKIVPQLFEYADGQAEGQRDVRIWVPGCARGEDAYSIAILVREHMLTLASPPGVLIFATDADPISLAIARDACYPAASLREVSASRLDRFFHHYLQGYVVAEEVRRLCVVALHEVTRDAPFSHLDLIVCGDLQDPRGGVSEDNLLATFHYALNPGGVLLLVAGQDDDVPHAGDLFNSIDKAQRIFRRRAIVRSSWSPHWSLAPPSEFNSGAEWPVAVNEELRCSKEELSTSKEALLSTHEELYTVNSELASKIKQLNRVNRELHTMFERAFMGRVQSLSRAYQLLSRDNRHSASLKELLHRQLEPFASEQRYSASGESFILTAHATVSLGMIIYELGTNAIKYGALSVADGYIDVSWELSAERLILNWIERNGPPVKEPTHKGFGSQLMQRQLSCELNGHLAMEFDPGGLRVRIDLPAHHLAQSEDSVRAARARTASDA